MDIASQKKELRAKILELRRKLPAQWVEMASERIFIRLGGLDVFKKCRTLMCYVDFNNEVATKKFIVSCLEKGIRVTVPVIVKKQEGGREMIASEIASLEELEVGTFGVLEPRQDNIRPIDAEELDIVIVPGLAFDLQKNRLGYGAGFYDRFLVKIRKDACKIGVAFENQVFPVIPADDRDISLDMIITDDRIIK